MATYRLSPAARADIEDIWDYTVAQWGRPQAERYVRKIADTCRLLATGEMVSQSAEAVRTGYRKARVGKHVVYFTRPDDDVQVIRILHQRMDVSGQLG